MDIHSLSSWATVIGFVITIMGALIAGFVKLRKRVLVSLKAPFIEWGFVDLPHVSEAHFYIIASNIKGDDFGRKILLTIKRNVFLEKDYGISVNIFDPTIGSEHITAVGLSKNVPENREETTYSLRLQSNMLYRIIVKCSGGVSGRYVDENFELSISSDEAKIIRKDISFAELLQKSQYHWFSRFMKFIRVFWSNRIV